jgi:hypothetical protein
MIFFEGVIDRKVVAQAMFAHSLPLIQGISYA